MPPTRQELFKEARQMYPHYTYLAKYKKHELEALLDQKCSKTNDFKQWADNSCYIDSLLFVINLLQIKPRRIRSSPGSPQQRQIITQIQESLNDLENTDTSTIRSLLQRFKGSIRIDWLIEQQEPMDLWRTLEEMFVMYKTKVLVEQIDGETNTLIDQRTSVLDTAIHETLPKKQKRLSLVSSTTSTHTPSSLFRGQYRKRKERTTILKADLLIFHINRRRFDTDTKVTDKVHIPMRMRPKENETPLYLKAIIVHHGSSGTSGHYTTVFECKGTWWEYDDMKTTIKRIGPTLPSSVLKNCTDCFLAQPAVHAALRGTQKHS